MLVRDEDWSRDVAYILDKVVNIFEQSKSENRPFFITIGFIDPHRDRTRTGISDEGELHENEEAQIRPPDVEVEFLSELPGARQEFANYYKSISRMDQGIGFILDGLEKARISDDTPPFINSKTALYDAAGVNLPFIVRSPGLTGHSNINPNLISYVDVLPTILDFAVVKGKNDNTLNDSAAPSYSYWPVQTICGTGLWISHIPRDSQLLAEPTRFVRTRRYKYHRNIAWRLDFPFTADIYGSLTLEDIRNADTADLGIGKMIGIFI
ncbi:hypothetical protein D9757_001128 [Collybiopsis confluens]|uniref:Sulfatase N-terminal domain-containing protein n=1 Tax=Collybiopsis confluens TaxID=2823264 RepID=A0A8H5I0X6_9AGAR|nr:hypothetical protein D9757_001128 [Collybiopsis confluens]